MTGEGDDERPKGTVAFLFTDIVGSTHRWSTEHDDMAMATARHDELIRAAVNDHSGYVFATGGDSFAVAFTSSRVAVDAALAIHSALESESWPTREPIRVRTGINLGDATQRDGDYFGPAVNLAARVESVAHGGQIVVTDVVAQTCGHPCTDLGTHTLKDIEGGTRLWQVGDATFPSLRSLTLPAPSLPLLRTATVGRDALVRDTCESLRDTRLLTLTGVGGTGKTRVAIEAAHAAQAEFVDGVSFVDLTTIDSPDQIWPAIQSALELVTDGDPQERVQRFLDGRQALIVLDNCEQLIDDVADAVDDLLGAVPGPTILVTSRESLGIAGERVVRLPGLAGEHAVELFSQRAVDAGATVDVETERDAISAICSSLDGIPLAIELAAARCATMSPAEISVRLDQRFVLLDGGRGRRRRRQQTLAGVMEWSHQLLTDEEKTLFRRLAVFAGTFDQIDVVAVCGFAADESERLLHALVEKSLIDVVRRDTGTDFRLLETVRLYGLERLLEVDELAQLREAHASHFGLAPLTDITLDDARQQSALEADRELRRVANTEAAIAHLLATDRVAEAAALVSTKSYSLMAVGRFGAYRDLFLVDHTRAEAAHQLRILRSAGAWTVQADYEVLFHLISQSREASERISIPPASEIHASWVFEVLMTSGVGEALPLANQYVQQANERSSPVGIAALHHWRSTALGVLGDVEGSVEAGRAGFDAAPASMNGLVCGEHAAWTLLMHGHGDAARSIAATLPGPRPGAFAHVQPLTIAAAQIGADADADVASRLTDLARRIVAGRVPSLEGDVLVAFMLLRNRRGDTDRIRHVADNFAPRTLGVPWALFMAAIDGWPDDERELRYLEVTQSLLDPVELRRRQAANVELLAEEVAFWESHTAEADIELS